jgi:hypothetical protein
MPVTPIYGLPFETPQSKPGITLTGDSDGSSPILAEAVESVLAVIEARITAIETTGYRRLTTLYYTAGVTAFTKASYTGFKAVKVRMVGGGGGGGGAAITSGTQLSSGSGGGGGAYAESFLLSAAIAASENVTVGAGGAGGVGVIGTAGSTSSFGTLVTAGGGSPGDTEITTGNNGVPGGSGGTAGTGDLIIPGSDGSNSRNIAVDTLSESPTGGASQFGGTRTASSSTGGNDGFAARNYGSGGSGAFNDDTEAAARTGGAGSAGLVIVEVYI